MRYGVLWGVIAIVICALATGTQAREGMWMPEQLPELAAELKAAGLQIDPTTRTPQLPLQAIARLGGCTGSFVGAQGLMITNYHCVLSSVQRHSKPERNLLRAGFLAKTQAEELPASAGSKLLITIETRNITSQIIDPSTAKLSGEQRVVAQETNEKAIIAACEQDVGYHCQVYSYYGGLQFHLVKQLEIRDLRLVYAPPAGVGMFGGETDNWMWPRHTGDFGFYRAYVSKDGKPADFSLDNVPYQPRQYLPLARNAVNAGEFVMAIGYPRTTNRYRLPLEIETTFGWSYPALNQSAHEQLSIIAEQTQVREAAQLAYVSRIATINNGLKKRDGLLQSYARSDLLARKRGEFEQFKQWLGADLSRKKLYASDLDALQEFLTRRAAIDRQEFLLEYVQPRFLITARGLYRIANERAKSDDLVREPGYQDRDLPDIEQALQSIEQRYDEQVDKALVQRFLIRYLALPGDEQNQTFIAALGMRRNMSPGQIRTQLDRLYAGTALADRATRLGWLKRSVAEFNNSDDTLIRAAVALYQDDLTREARDKELDGLIQRAYANYVKGFIAYKNSKREAVYPDANSTVRVTFGDVAGPAVSGESGAVANAFTTLEGIVAKHLGHGDFDAPEAQLAAIKAGNFGEFSMASLGSVPVNFLSTIDITGGNSGSPVLNRRGELVGLVFDGTLDSVISDWAFDATNTRTVAVDIRYIMWQMQRVDGAGQLLKEMNWSMPRRE